MKHIKRSTLHTLLGLCASFIATAVFLGVTNPYKLPIAFLMIPSVLIGLTIFFFIRLTQRAEGAQGRRTALMLSIYAVVLLLLASLQQLGWRDVIISGLLMGLVIFYINRYRR